jgi:hypothetical protein
VPLDLAKAKPELLVIKRQIITTKRIQKQIKKQIDENTNE